MSKIPYTTPQLSQQELYAMGYLPRGVYPQDLPPVNYTGVQQILQSGGPSVPLPQRPIVVTQPSRAPYLYNLTSPLSVGGTNPSFNPQQLYNQQIPPVRARSVPATRSSTRSGFSLEQLQASGPKQATFDSTYFLQPLIGHLPENEQEQFLENLYEKHCRCRLHVGSSYLQRVATAASYGKQSGLDLQDEERKSQSVPYAVCTRNLRGSLRQLEDQGLQVAGTAMPACGENFNFDNIPAIELYWFIYNKYKSEPLFSDLPQFINNDQYLESIRPQLLDMLHKWQAGKVPSARYWRD